MAESNNFDPIYEGPIRRDESMNLSEILNQTSASTKADDSEKMASLSDLVVTKEVTEEKTPKKSPLEIEMEKKAQRGNGLVLSNEEIKNNEQKPLKDFSNNERREKEFNEYIEDMDEKIDSAKSLKLVNSPTSNLEMAEMMAELDEYKDKKAKGEEIGKMKYLSEKKESESSDDADEEMTEEEKKKEEERKQLVEIVIDKTGLGFENIEFSDEEKEKIRYANEIKLKEVETLDLNSIVIARPDKSFLDTIAESTSASSLSATTVPLPGSRYKVSVKGLSYGQLGDILLNEDTKNFDRIHKQYSIIYNSLGTPSIGKFQNFEDFLRNTAFTDMDMLLYGLIVSTFPEIETIPLSCRRCGQQFGFEYTPRTLLDLENCSDAFLNNMKAVTDCPANEVIEFNKNSFLKKRKVIKLPFSGYLIEFGLASAYDYLYNMVDIIFGDSFKQEHPDDTNGILQFNAAFISMIRSIYIPNGNGSYLQFTNGEDIIQALYRVKVDEFPMISGIVTKYIDEYTPQFAFKNVTCPKCKIVTPRVPADLNNLVFRKYQRLLSTEINAENIL